MSSKKQPKPKKKPVKKTEYSYTIDDNVFGEFKIVWKDTGKHKPWWADDEGKEKVIKLITGYRMDCKASELLVLARISYAQLRTFRNAHPELAQILDVFRKTPTLKARMTVVRAVTTDVNTAKWYLERKEPNEFKEKSEVEVKKPILVEGMFSDDDDEDDDQE